MIYVVKYTNPNSFMKEWAKDPAIKVESDGKPITTGVSYKNANVPGTSVLFTPGFSNGKMLIDLTQDQINEIVSELKLYDKRGNEIKEAPLGTQNHPFWMSEFAYHLIEGGQTRLDDNLPKDRLILAGMRMDREYWFKGSSKPFVKGVHKWMVYPIEESINEIVEEESGSMEAVKLLGPMNHEKRVNIAKILGKPIDIKSDPEIVYATLFRLITTEKNLIAADGKTFLQKFLELARAGNAELNVEALVRDSTKYFEKRGGYYYYGEIKMGKNTSEIVEKLKLDVDLMHELDRKRK